MSKSVEAFRTIAEVADELGVPKHVLRFWEIKFPQIRPMKRGGGRRYYRPEDLELLRGIQALLHAEAYTIKGVQKILREQGIDQVKTLGRDPLPASGRKRRGRSAEASAGDVVSSAATNTVVPANSATRTVSRSRTTAAAARHAGADRRTVIEAVIKELQACRVLLRDQPAEPRRDGETGRARASR